MGKTPKMAWKNKKRHIFGVSKRGKKRKPARRETLKSLFVYKRYLRENFKHSEENNIEQENVGNPSIILTCKYRLINHINEYWYMGSMLAKSEMVKNSMEECLATWKLIRRNEE